MVEWSETHNVQVRSEYELPNISSAFAVGANYSSADPFDLFGSLRPTRNSGRSPACLCAGSFLAGGLSERLLYGSSRSFFWRLGAGHSRLRR
jgi:hypothetical protein